MYTCITVGSNSIIQQKSISERIGDIGGEGFPNPVSELKSDKIHENNLLLHNDTVLNLVYYSSVVESLSSTKFSTRETLY